jgi:hypothetical protein
LRRRPALLLHREHGGITPGPKPTHFTQSIVFVAFSLFLGREPFWPMLQNVNQFNITND